jgi:hypothetical protein
MPSCHQRAAIPKRAQVKIWGIVVVVLVLDGFVWFSCLLG